MNRVRYVPADPQARAAQPLAVLEVKTCRNPHHGDPKTKKRRLTVREADRLVPGRGWVRLADLAPAEQRTWRESNRKAKEATCSKT